MTATLADGVATANRIQTQINHLEDIVYSATKPTLDVEIRKLHKLLNTAALQVASFTGQSTTYFNGSPGTYDTDSGGTAKGGGS